MRFGFLTGVRSVSSAARVGRLVVLLASLGALAAAAVTAGVAQAPALAASMHLTRPFSRTAGLTGSEPTITSQTSVDGVPNGSVPAPPADAMGSPADSTLVSSDDLLMTRIDSTTGQTSSQWAKVNGTALGSEGGYGDVAAPPLLNSNVPTAAGRFRDINSDRVMSLRMTALGPDALLTLSSNNDTAESGRDASSQTPTLCGEIGDTCSLRNGPKSGPGSMLTMLDGMVGPYVRVESRVNSDPGNDAQRWTFVGDGRDDGYFELVSKSNGLCLTDSAYLGGAAGLPCADPTSAPADQLWKEITHAGGTSGVAFAPKVDDGELLTLWCDPGPCDGVTFVLAPNALGTAQQGYQIFYASATGEPGGAIPTWSKVIPHASPATPFAMAAGDLDRAVDADGNYHDEAVVAYADDQHRLQVRVVDYNANPDHLLVSAPAVALPVVGAVKAGVWFPGSVGVAVGDFDGSALNQIAVTWQDQTGRFHLTLLAYRETDDGGRVLTVIGDPMGITLFPDQKATESLTSGYADTIAGEFDHGGQADVAIAYAAANPGTTQLTGHLGVVSLAPDFSVRGEATVQFNYLNTLLDSSQDGGTWTGHGLKLAAGLFKFDPQTGFTFQRRELAVAWTEGGSETVCSGAGCRSGPGARDFYALYDVDPAPDCTSDSCTLSIDAQRPAQQVRSGIFSSGDTLPLSLAAGGYAGQGTGGDPPLWGLVLALPPVRYAGIASIDPPSSSLIFVSSTTTVFGYQNYNPAWEYLLTAYDREGLSLAVGAPLVATVTKLVRTTLVAAQPPTHADWLDGKFVNVSRVGGFAVQLGSEQTTKYSFDSSTKSGWTVGLTQSADWKGSFAVGTKATGYSGYLQFKEKFSKNWAHASTDFNKYSTTISSSADTTGSDDDIVQGMYATYYVYRYPILNPPRKNPDGSPVSTDPCVESGACRPFYEVTIPGQVVPVNSFGRDLSWYQPSWQNGDALSYPKLADGQVVIPDLGGYSYVNPTDGHTVTVTKPLLDTVNSVGGGETTAALTITGQTGSGNTTTNSNSWNLGSEVKAGMEVHGDFGVFKSKAAGSFSLGVNGGQSFADTTTGSTTSTSGRSFVLTIPTIDSNKSYRVGTAYYYDTAGVPKVIHGVDLTSNVGGSEFWQRYYGQAPDPALNLPDATFLTYNDLGQLIVPVFNPEANRQLIRGFSALQPVDPSSPAISGAPYATDPLDGQQVTFAVQVHDYSLVDSPPVPVYFYAVPVDATGLNVTGPPQMIGTVNSLPIPSQGMVTVKSPAWTAKANGLGAQSYRIFVVLDPDDRLHEIHPWKAADGSTCPVSAIDPDAAPGTVVDGKMVDPMTGEPETLACGQNNQGYGTITVMPTAAPTAPLDTSPPAFTASVGILHGVDQPGPADPAAARLRASEIADGNLRQLRLGAHATVPTVRAGEPVTGLVYTSADANTTAIQPVLVYDGPPSAGHLIAAVTEDGATKAEGGFAQFTWVPTTPGLHTIYELMVGSDPATDSRQTMKVDVLPPLSRASAAAQAIPVSTASSS